MSNMTTKEKIKVEIFHANTGIKYGFFDGQFFFGQAMMNLSLMP